jgi:hypothetical protein
MPPSKIMVIRHGEKPPDTGGPPFGINPDGQQNSHALIVRGWSRAGALIRFFSAPQSPIERPAMIYAAAPDVSAHSLHGARPSQTVTPLSAALGVPLATTYAVGDETSLAAAISKETGVVLVSWEHHAITAIVAKLLDQPGFDQQWPGKRFDLVWILDANGTSYSLSEVNQGLLDGDEP